MFRVRNFEYNGFFGRSLKGFAPYKAKFKEWTSDPGIGVFECSDGKERLIPTFALIGEAPLNLPEQPKTGVMFGSPCKS